MAAFPTVTLATPFIAQVEYAGTSVSVLQIADDVDRKSLSVFCWLGENPSFKYWIQVLDASTYTVDWTNDMINAAIVAFFNNPV